MLITLTPINYCAVLTILPIGLISNFIVTRFESKKLINGDLLWIRLESSFNAWNFTLNYLLVPNVWTAWSLMGWDPVYVTASAMIQATYKVLIAKKGMRPIVIDLANTSSWNWVELAEKVNAWAFECPILEIVSAYCGILIRFYSLNLTI